MIRRLIGLLPLVMLFACDSGIPVTAQVEQGRVEGREADGVRRFLGIPYAAPPVGELRWTAPRPPVPWQGTLDASAYGRWCAQPDFDRRDEGKVTAGEGWTIFEDVPANEDSGEDCLTANVLVRPDARNLPVMVFLHGNALGSSFAAYDGAAFARSGVVFVSANFRLHTMGNFAHPSLTEAAADGEPLARYTEMDIVALLRWVQDNIAAFGGDADNVTVVGSSNGGALILQMLANPDVEGLFHKAIVQSGNGWWSPLEHSEHEQLGCQLATRAGLEGCSATAKALRSVPWHQIPVTGPYTVDNRHWRLGATEAIGAGRVVDVPLMIGWNDFDGSSLRFSPEHVIANTPAEVLDTYADEAHDSNEDLAYAVYTDLHSGAPARWVAHQLEEGAPTYLYLFSYVLSSERGSTRGAEHAYELPHVFDSWEALLPPVIGRFVANEEDFAMTRIMHACWVSFIESGTPVCPGAPEWPAYRRSDDQLMELTLEPRVVQGYRSAQLNAQERAMDQYLARAKASKRNMLAGEG